MHIDRHWRLTTLVALRFHYVSHVNQLHKASITPASADLWLSVFGLS